LIFLDESRRTRCWVSCLFTARVKICAEHKYSLFSPLPSAPMLSRLISMLLILSWLWLASANTRSWVSPELEKAMCASYSTSAPWWSW